MEHKQEALLENDSKEKKTLNHLFTTVISTESGFDSLEKEWNDLVFEADGTHFVQTYEWQRTWWDHFGDNKILQILVFREGEQLVGILPMFLDRFRIFRMSLYYCLRMIGGRVIQPEGGYLPVGLPFGDYLTLIAHPRYVDPVIDSCAGWLHDHRQIFDTIWFEEVPQDSPLMIQLLPLMEKNAWDCTKRQASICPVTELPASWDDLLKGLSGNSRYQVRRFVKRVEEKNLFEFHRVQSKEDVDQVFQKLVEFHQHRWHNLGQPGIFADNRMHNFFKEITLRFHDKGWLQLDLLTSGGHYEAIDLSFRFKETLYMIQRGFNDASLNKKYGPGNVLLYLIMKDAIEEGLKTYDFLRGGGRQKYLTATNTHRNKEVVIMDKSKGSVYHRFYSFIHLYAHLRRRLRNESEILKVYSSGKSFLTGFGIYLGNFYHRLFR